MNKRIILASISGFGQDGPYRARPGFDQIAQGLSGIMSVTGHPGGGPMRVGCAVADVGAGLLAALGIMTALLERERSGEGQWVQSNLLQAAIQLLDFQAARYAMSGEVPQQVGNDHPTSMPTSAYTTLDGHMNVAASGTKMWQRVCEAIGRPELFEHPDYKSAEARAHRFYSVCVNGSRVSQARHLLDDTDVKVACVVGFPLGAMSGDAKRFETEAAVDEGAHEIDRSTRGARTDG